MGRIRYHGTHQVFPPESIWGYGAAGSMQPRNYTWITLILPFVEQAPLHDAINFSLPLWGQTLPNGETIVSQQISMLRCPSDAGFSSSDQTHGVAITNYVGAEGYDWHEHDNDYRGGVFTIGGKVPIGDLKDGTSNTILAAEVTSFGYQLGPIRTTGTGVPRVGAAQAVCRAALLATPYADEHADRQLPQPDGSGPITAHGDSFQNDPEFYKPTYIAAWGINADWPGPTSEHTGGAQFLMADGSVNFLSETMDYWVYLAQNTKNGGEAERANPAQY